ncbi:MAG: STAS-like domain-containing protein [Candidatus Magnetobacterium sp. LHC-1]|uniref:STAS-like domain-containing protein n=1 Tax=Candidatus Magnetobacterium casense TaxID=1455061 RepID=A0ABS6S2E8_9BACT|nr:STAS-like domain-containing protein [Candidatus Magnetobacterium casensis]MBF0607940.1 STAS-like domain-containing protein [Nitrospirota bacterium]MBV6342802.1 STAS-like domain-containing protein [Candidatus Magnetobacterium casensis]
MKIDIYKEIGEICITMQDGQKIFDQIHPILLAGNTVELNFENVNLFASLFFNASIGRLLEDIKSEDLNRLVKITNINSIGRTAFRRSIENAREYYGNKKRRDAVDEVLLQQAEEL